MLRRFVICSFLLLALSGVAFAQQQAFEACFTASAGVPYTCDLGQLFGLDQLASLFAQIDSSGEVFGFTFTFALAPASNELPGVTVSPDGVLSGTPTSSGSFTINVQLTEIITLNGQTFFNQTFAIPLPIFVQGTTQGGTVVDPTGLAFSVTQGVTSPSTQIITISNRDSQAITYTASASVDSGTNWLSVSPSTGTAGPFAVASIVATVNASNLPAGTYPGTISIVIAGGKSFSIPVVITVTGTQGGVTVSQSGLLFRAVQGGSSPPSQSIEVINAGSGTVSFSSSASTLTGGGWLSVSPASGTTSSSSPGSVTISINQTGLAPNTYYGEVAITSAGSTSPEIVAVVLNVFTAAQSPGPSVSTAALIFVAQAGGSNPAAQTVALTNPSPNPVTFATTLFSDTSASVFFTAQPQSGTLNSMPVPISVQPMITGLAAGVYFDELALTFVDPASKAQAFQSRVAIVLIVVPSGSTASGSSAAPLASTSCKPTKLIPVSTGLGSLFQISAGWPQALQITVVDDCGVKLTTGSVVATFSSGDPALPLASLNNGQWTATWNPQSGAGSEVTITIQAQEVQPPLLGTASLGGTLLANPSVPIVSANGIDSAVSNVPHQPIGPGSFINIYGSALSQGTNLSKSLPFAPVLGGTQAMVGGKVMPLYYSSTGLIIGIVPFDVPVNTTKQLVVFLNGAISVPVPVVLSAAQPAIFTRNQSGSGLGVIVGYKASGGAPFLIDSTHPVSVGDTLVIYATGLGPVNQPVAAGAAGPSSPLAHTVNTVTAIIGGVTVPKVAFSGLAPGLPFYQVNVVVPKGVTAGSSVPVVLSTAGLQSTPVTIVVK